MTVSRVLSGKDPKRVSAATRARVLKVAEELGYQPNIAARALRDQRTYQFALVVPYVHLSFMPDIMQSLQDVAMRNHYTCLVYLTDFKPEVESRIFRDLVIRRVDGVIWLPGPERSPEVDRILKSIPCVQLLHKEVTDTSAVLVDQETGGYVATRHLIELGHRHIGSLMLFDRHGRQRQAGFTRAMEEARLTPDRTWQLKGSTWEAAYRRVSELLPELRQVTALVCYSDLSAWATMRALQDGDLQVPRDVSVVGFDNTPAAQYLNPPLTTVAQPTAKIGEEAMRLLLRQINGEKPEDVVLKPSIVTRASTRSLADSNCDTTETEGR